MAWKGLNYMLLNLHVQYWEECEACGYDSSLDQDEAAKYEPRPCPACEEREKG